MLVDGLRRTEAGAQLSRELREVWLSSCLKGWKESGYMYEKYDASRPGQFGAGGEYEPQVGFGWSNGVVLVFLAEEAEEQALASGANAQPFGASSGSKSHQTSVMDVFMEWDSDSSGIITEAEFSGILMQLDPAAFHSAQIKKLFEAFDTRKDGKIDYREFINWLFKK